MKEENRCMVIHHMDQRHTHITLQLLQQGMDIGMHLL